MGFLRLMRVEFLRCFGFNYDSCVSRLVYVKDERGVYVWD